MVGVNAADNTVNGACIARAARQVARPALVGKQQVGEADSMRIDVLLRARQRAVGAAARRTRYHILLVQSV